MYIVIYSKFKKDIERVLYYVRDTVLRDFQNIIKCTHEGIIDIGPKLIRIDFRYGEYPKLAGIRPNYYYIYGYNPDVRMMLQYAVDKCNGRELNSLKEIKDIVIEYLKSITTEVKSDETDI